MELWTVAAIILVLNVPFGYWRANVERLSVQWFTAIHLPVPFVILLRVTSGLGWQLSTFPILVGSFFAGQYLGGKIFRTRHRSGSRPLTSCLVMDLLRRFGRGDKGETEGSQSMS